MKIYGPGWEEVKPLGSGGQGKVFLVRTPESVKERKEHLLVIRRKIRELRTNRMEPDEEGERAAIDLVSAIDSYASQDDPAHFGALKLFDITGDGPEAQKAMGRLESEVKALNEISHPSILKLLYVDVQSRRMITEYHPNGTLADNRSRFTGNVRACLEAFHPLVKAVAILHERGIIHRDIKPENIFVGSDGRLVLGDFGIVFFQDETKERLTSTIGEKVGTADWMAPWANLRERFNFDEINPTFDVFPLGKVLWWMISGKTSLPFWYHRKPAYDLEIIYPRDPDMALVNRILDRCVVEEEKNCLLPDAKALLEVVDEALEVVSGGGQLLGDGVYRPCRVCGKGQYIREHEQAHIYRMGPPFIAEFFRCNACGHIQMFANRKHGA